MAPKEFYQIAKRVARVYSAFGATAQSTLETGWFTSPLCVRYHNYGGIKTRKGDDWQKAGLPFIAISSNEQFKDGSVKKQVSLFRVYASAEDYLIRLNDKFLEKGTFNNYRVVRLSPNCFWLYFAGLKIGGWATDWKYFQKLCDMAVKLAPELIGSQWKQSFHSSYQYAKSTGVLSEDMETMIEDTLRRCR
jgi:flagellum-specific peptidoglycan hydrolase FlgJ